MNPADRRERNRAVVDATLAALAPLPVRARAMFGGFGLYIEDRFCGLVADGVLYFRTDGTTREEYVSRGMTAFQPNNRPIGPKTVPRNFQVPPEVIADANLLKEWASRAARAAR